jgi:hypothetical protein
MKHSTTKPTREEAAYIEAIKTGPCIACLVWDESGQSPPMFVGAWGCDAHHLLSGGHRIGHFFAIGLCGHHHRRIPLEGFSHAHMRALFGPSLMDGSKTFRATYGSDAELLARQDESLRQRGIEPPVRPDNRRWSHAA